MRNFAATLALLACSALAQVPDPPTNDEFPDEWTSGKSCMAGQNIGFSQVLEYSEEMQKDMKQWYGQYKYKRAYCKMQANPGYPTTNPHGLYHLYQFSPSSPVWIWGCMKSLPYQDWRYALTINERRWDQRECCSAGRHFQLPWQTHGWNSSNMEWHVGDLWGCPAHNLNACWHFQSAEQPSFWATSSPAQPSIFYKTMVLYEDEDDYGQNSDVDPAGNPTTNGAWDSREYGSAGPRIACCTITPYWIDWQQADEQHELKPAGKGRMLTDEQSGEEVEVFTPDQFRELFGFEPEKLPGEDDWIDQN